MSPLKLIIIRHALSEGNKEGRMMGHLDDELAEEGVAQAKALAQSFVGQQCSPSAIYSSPTQRAFQTATIMLNHYGVLNGSTMGDRPSTNVQPTRHSDNTHTLPTIHCCEELKEFQNGIFQGLTWTDARQRYPELCHRLETSLSWVPIPGAESLQGGRMRARRFIQALLRRHANGEVIWVISHEWIMQHLIAELIGGDRTWGIAIPPTGVFEFWLDRFRWFTQGQDRWNGELWKIHRFNDTSHLMR